MPADRQDRPLQRLPHGPQPQKHLWLLGIALASALASCKPGPASQAKPTDKAAAPGKTQAGGKGEALELAVQVTLSSERELPAVIELAGALAADEISEVAAPTAGIVTEVLVDLGSRVKKGDVLVRIDRRDAAMRLSQAAAVTSQAYARLGIRSGESFNAARVPEVQLAKEAQELADLDAKRAKALVDGGSAPQAQYDTAKARLEQARLQVQSATNAAQQAWASLQAARATQELSEKAASDTEVRAPFDGIVTERRIAAGEYCQPGKIVAVVMNDTPLRLRFDVPETYAAQLSEGKEVLASFAAWPGENFSGAIRRIGGALRSNARTLPVEAELPNLDHRLRPGYFAKLLVLTGGAPHKAVLVPEAAIGSSGSAARVFVIEGGRAVEHVVAVGRRWQGWVEVRGGVLPGEQVATSSLDLLIDGAKVTLQK